MEIIIYRQDTKQYSHCNNMWLPCVYLLMAAKEIDKKEIRNHAYAKATFRGYALGLTCELTCDHSVKLHV